MKFFKGLFLVIVVICMIAVLLVLQAQFTIQKTLLSSKYFDKAYEAHDMDIVIGELITEQIESLPEKLTEGFSDGEAGDGEGMDFSLDIEGMIDEVWLKEQIELTISGMLKYFTGSADVLPSIDMVPVKEMLLDVVIDQMNMFGDIDGDLSQLDEILDNYKELAGDSQDDVIDHEAIKLMDEAIGDDGLGVDLLEIIISASINLDESINTSEKADAIIAEVVKNQMDYDEINDELDINVLLETIFSDGGNPLFAVRTMILAFKTTLFYALLMLLLLLTLMVAITAFRPPSILGWLSAPLIISGLIVTILSVLEMVLFKITDITMSLPPSIGVDSAENIMSFVTDYIDGVQGFMLTSGIVLLVVGIIFAVLAGIFKSVAKNKVEEKPKHWWLTLIRVFVVLCLLATTFFIMRGYYNEISDDITDSISVLNNVQETMQEGDLMEAFTKSSGITFLNFGGEE